MVKDAATLCPVAGSTNKPLLGTYRCPGVITWHIALENNTATLSDLKHIPWASRTFGPQRPLFTCTKVDEQAGIVEYAGCLEVVIESSGEIMRGYPFTAQLTKAGDELVVWGLNQLEEGLSEKDHPLVFQRVDSIPMKCHTILVIR
ncbi:hypothetical protein IAT40_007973 [Kwoniella sp. CBS 6097]